MILIIGAGLSGLLTAYRLKQAGIPFKILEARKRLGGRINTVYDVNNTPTEMGATWFTFQHRNLITLIDELAIEHFEQYMDNPLYFQASPHSQIESLAIPQQSPSYRIAGGTSAIINSLRQKLDKDDVLFNQSVTKIKIQDNYVLVTASDMFEGNKVVLALPPKLWANKMVFEPSLPVDLLQVAKQTHTWMEDSIKIALTYKNPFWEPGNLIRTFFSNSGPITEFYEHCNQDKTTYALCGFMNSSYKNLSDSERRRHVLNQMKQVFGEKALEFVDYEECIWSQEENTFVADNRVLYPHQNNGNPIFRQSYMEDKLIISSSESAAEFPGYMDGAVHSGNEIAEKIIKSLENN